MTIYNLILFTSHFVQCKLQLFIIHITINAMYKVFQLQNICLFFEQFLKQQQIHRRFNATFYDVSTFVRRNLQRLKIFLRHKCTRKFAIQLNNPLSVRFSSNEGGTIDIFLKIPSSKTSNETSTSRTVGASLKLPVANRSKFTLLY